MYIMKVKGKNYNNIVITPLKVTETEYVERNLFRNKSDITNKVINNWTIRFEEDTCVLIKLERQGTGDIIIPASINGLPTSRLCSKALVGLDADRILLPGSYELQLEDESLSELACGEINITRPVKSLGKNTFRGTECAITTEVYND